MYEYDAKILRVVDGDTLAVECDLGFDVSTRLNVRLSGLDAPERNTVEGKAAIAWLEVEIATRGSDCTLRTIKDRREKFGRYLGVFTFGEWCLNDALLAAGHAKLYDGGKR